MRPPPEPVQVVKERRDGALGRLVDAVPYAGLLGVRFDRRGDELTAVLSFADRLIGNPMLPAIHGGVTASFLEVTAIVELAWARLWDEIEAGAADGTRGDPADGASDGAPEALILPPMPRTIDFTTDFLRPGLPRDAYARARIVRSGRRYASVHVEAWQDNRARLFAQATGHFLMPEAESGAGSGAAPDGTSADPGQG